MRVFTLRELPEEFHRRIKIQAAKEGLTMQKLIVQAIEEYLEREGG